MFCIYLYFLLFLWPQHWKIQNKTKTTIKHFRMKLVAMHTAGVRFLPVKHSFFFFQVDLYWTFKYNTFAFKLKLLWRKKKYKSIFEIKENTFGKKNKNTAINWDTVVDATYLNVWMHDCRHAVSELFAAMLDRVWDSTPLAINKTCLAYFGKWRWRESMHTRDWKNPKQLRSFEDLLMVSLIFNAVICN